MFFILFSILCCLSSFLLLRKRPKSKCEPPTLAGGLPVIGHVKMIYGNSIYLWNFIKKMSQECNEGNGVMKGYIGPVKIYLLTDPDDCATALNACNQKHYAYFFAKPWLGSGLLIAPVAKWKVHRKLLNPLFNQRTLNNFIGIFNKQATRLSNIFDEEVVKGPFNHESHLLVSSLETICQTTLGVDVSDKSARNVEYLNAIEQLISIFLQRFTKIWLHNKYVYNMSSLKKQQDELLKIIHNMTNTVLQAWKRKLASENGTDTTDINDSSDKFSSFMDLILKLSLEKGTLTDADVLDEVNTLIVTGYDTVADTLCHVLTVLGSYPEVQERLYKEILGVFGEFDRDVEKLDLSKLVYMESVIQESLRYIPTIPLIARYNKTDITLKNYVITAGSTFVVLMSGIHSNSVWGKDVHKFRPERWLDPATLPQNPNAFAAFGIGRRSCIGKSYAMMSIKITLTHILRRYKITSDITKLVLKMEVLLKPASGQHIRLERRK